MEIICNITEILHTDKENHKKNRFYHPERVIVIPELTNEWRHVETVYISVCLSIKYSIVQHEIFFQFFLLFFETFYFG